MKNLEIKCIQSLPELLGTPSKGIIFTDVDGVWIDENNNFSFPDPQYTEAIRVARESGYWVVLNSDTAPRTLQNFATQLGANNWNLAENGGVIYISSVGCTYRNVTEESNRIFASARTAVYEPRDSTIVWEGDATGFLQSNQTFETAREGETVYLINSERMTSFGVYTRRVSAQNKLYVDDASTRKTEALLTRILSNSPETTLTCKRYPLIGSCLLKNPEIKKTDSVYEVISQYTNSTLSYWMIGDTINDSMRRLSPTKVIRIGSVSNADEELKKESIESDGYISPYPLAEGAADILYTILKREGVRI